MIVGKAEVSFACSAKLLLAAVLRNSRSRLARNMLCHHSFVDPHKLSIGHSSSKAVLFLVTLCADHQESYSHADAEFMKSDYQLVNEVSKISTAAAVKSCPAGGCTSLPA